MKLLISLFLSLTFFSLEAATLMIGAKLPNTEKNLLTTVDGKTLKLDTFKGPKGTLVIFTCNECPYVKKWESRMARIGNQFAKDVGVVMVNSNDSDANPKENLDAIRTRAKNLALQFSYVQDSTSGLARTFGAEKTPDIFLFDANGTLVYKGAVDSDASSEPEQADRWLENALTNLVSGKKISPDATKSMGCSIKFRS